jgi:hypothetical protein
MAGLFSDTRKKSTLEKIVVGGTFGILTLSICISLYLGSKNTNKLKENNQIQIERFEDRDNVKGYDTIILNEEAYQIIREYNNYRLIKKQ